MKISIVTATWNSGATVRDTIESVLAQTYPDIEYIIIDGGSKDNTLDIVKEYEPRFGGRMHWISEPDHGIYDAMNKGIHMATGDVVGILNSDDFYTSERIIETVAKEFVKMHLDAVYGDIHYVNDEDLTKCVRYYSSKGFRRWKMRFGFMPAHPSFYCKKDIYETCGYFDTDFKVAADFECLLRFIFINRIKTSYIPMDFVTMRTGGASSSGMQSHKRIWRDHKKAYQKHNIYSNAVFESMRYLYKIVDLAWYRMTEPIMRKHQNPSATTNGMSPNQIGGGKHLVISTLLFSEERRAA